jgi:hypothetical protein
MVRYFYAWTPLVIVATAVLLSLPWLGLIALMIVSLVALAAFAFAIVFVPFMLIRAISRRWQGRSGASPRTAAVLSPVTRQPTLAAMGRHGDRRSNTIGGLHAVNLLRRGAPGRRPRISFQARLRYGTSTPSTNSWIAPAAKPPESTVSLPASVSISSRSFAASG